MKENFLKIKGAREKNLKNVDVCLPKNKLVVFTGISGSGKTSLAFSTIYNEGKRRYMESLSSYARQFLGNSEKPDVDQIEGLAPSIAIDQKTVSHNPRSTVGTITEIYDYLRLLYARAGQPYCINGHGPIQTNTIQEILDKLKKMVKITTSIKIFAPVAIAKKGSFQDLFKKLKKEGFWQIWINGQGYTLDTPILLNKNKQHNINVLVDEMAFTLDQDTQTKIYAGIEIATKYAEGLVMIEYFSLAEKQQKEILFSQKFSCKVCNFGLEEIEPKLLSFNTLAGACAQCKGLGTILDVDMKVLVPNPALSINQGGIVYFIPFLATQHPDWLIIKAIFDYYNFDLDTPIQDLPSQALAYIYHGTGTKSMSYKITVKSGKVVKFFHPYRGLLNLIKRRYLMINSKNSFNYRMLKKYLYDVQCSSCQGARLNPAALSLQINKLNIYQFTRLPIKVTLPLLASLNLSAEKKEIVQLVITEIKNRLHFLDSVGLNYLTLERSAKTLSGGEAQRIRLATQIGSKLTGVIYVLDEPSIGLHQYDNQKLISTLKSMRNLGNSILVVEHDLETILNSDWVVDIGPLGGTYGGEIIHSGPVKTLLENNNSITAKYLNGKETISLPLARRKPKGEYLEIIGANANNLKTINVKIPLYQLVCITGVSGSGKSTLMNDVIYQGIKLKQKTSVASDYQGSGFKDIKNFNKIENVIWISQDPIGKTPRSNPVTYTNIFTHIRELFANTLAAKSRGYKVGHFSFNVPIARCQTCKGGGVIFHSMLFMPDVYIKCEACQGKRYNPEVLQIKYKSKNIADVLAMEVDKAILFFAKNIKIKKKLQVLVDIGLGYLKLGQSSTELSGGEAQRIKLANFLNKTSSQNNLYILDEPTTGLHSYDIKKLLNLLNRLVDRGESVLMIEHNLDIIKSADYLIDLGPLGGDKGGEIVAQGTPEAVAKVSHSYTGQFLQKILPIFT